MEATFPCAGSHAHPGAAKQTPRDTAPRRHHPAARTVSRRWSRSAWRLSDCRRYGRLRPAAAVRPRQPPRSGNPAHTLAGKSPSPHAAWCRRRSAGTPRALSVRRPASALEQRPKRGAAIRLRVPGKAGRPGAAGTSHGNAVKLAEIRLLHIRAGYRGQSGLGQRNGSRQRQRSRRERGGAQELLHACYNRRAGEAVHKAPVRHRPANGLLPTAPDGLARPVRSSAEGSRASQPTMHVPHRSPGSALIKLAQSYAIPSRPITMRNRRWSKGRFPADSGWSAAAPIRRAAARRTPRSGIPPHPSRSPARTY